MDGVESYFEICGCKSPIQKEINDMGGMTFSLKLCETILQKKKYITMDTARCKHGV